MRNSHEIRVGGQRIKIHYTDPSFLEGMARIFDWSGALDQPDTRAIENLRAGRSHRTGLKEDSEAIRGYWIEVGKYIRGAMERFEAEELSGTKSARSDE